ncbi:hypothetical protein [Polynucleobacter asymbioticus]|uniref:pPIWI-associating nuclease domain-containing protein n=1 Tax=Polynucleobacter asymbioticus TaxID=576611 RepID=UPI0013723F8F|nr:hypothetical protein [Polynucleobacter asymbioticus]
MLKDFTNNLFPLLRNDFQKKLLSATLKNLEDLSNPLCFNNFCSGYRELIRHVLSEMAPDSEIKACAWYAPDKTSRTGITRAHAITYVLQGGLSSDYVIRTLKLNVLVDKKRLIDAINTLHKYTHVNEDTFGIDALRASDEANLAINALHDVIVLANQCRVQLARALEAQIHKEVIAAAIGETIGAIDELATHHCIDDINVEVVTILGVCSEFIYLKASGTIEVELQWGSNGDLRRGEGIAGKESFPFTCELQSHVEYPAELEIAEGAFCVDTSSWWDGYYDEE